MNSDQKTVAIGALTGVLSMVVLVYVLFLLLPSPGTAGVLDRIVFTLKMNVLAIVPLFIMLIWVGNGRFLSDAIDPTRHAESARMEINGRVVDNTLQQNLVFLIATLALATIVTDEQVKVIGAMTATFIIARIVFWVGYRVHPLYRAPGMSSTAYMNAFTLVYVLYSLV